MGDKAWKRDETSPPGATAQTAAIDSQVQAGCICNKICPAETAAPTRFLLNWCFLRHSCLADHVIDIAVEPTKGHKSRVSRQKVPQ